MATPTTIDFSLYLKGTDQGKRQVAKAFVSNLKRDGFAKLQNHGVPPEVVSQIWDWVMLSVLTPTEGVSHFARVVCFSISRKTRRRRSSTFPGQAYNADGAWWDPRLHPIYSLKRREPQRMRTN